jgi:cytochrome c biogenesis protein CcmG/thiol:disulfide interchange protein DsbE
MKIIWTIGLIIFSVITSSCSTIKPANENPEGKVISCAEIKVTDNPAKDLLLDCLDNQTQIDFSDLTGPTVINFWGSWCAPCRDEMPYFVELASDLPAELSLIGIAREEKSMADAEKFVIDFGITFPQLYDPTGKTKAVVGPSVPVTLFIDKKGQIVHQHIGPVDSVDEIRLLISQYLGIQ